MKNKKTYIEKLVEQGEHQTLDFKFEISDSKKIARTLSAFSNTAGGSILIGVKDNGVIAGIRSDEEIHMLQAAAEMYCQPKVILKFTEFEVLGKTVLEATVPKNTEALVSAPDKNGDYKIYVRRHDQNILANGIYIQTWKLKKQENPVHIYFSNNEKSLLELLREHHSMSFSQLKKHLKLTSNKLTKLIVDFILVDILTLKITEKGYFYQLNSHYVNEDDTNRLMEKNDFSSNKL
jgi:predicted HTH transcriptional regulator